LKNISIDYRDVPINESYIQHINDHEGIEILSKSKWLNCVHIRGNYNHINELLNFDFIDRIDYANRNINRDNDFSNKDKFGNIEYHESIRSPIDQIQMINLGFLHNNGFTGSGITIGVFDAGFRNVDNMQGFNRLRNLGNIKYTYDFVDRTEDLFSYTGNSHGTNVLSIIAGFIESEYYGTAIDVEAMERADSLGIDVANTSLGYRIYNNSSYSYSQEEMDGNTAFITRGSNIAYEKGIILVNSAGNSAANGIIAPADSEGVLSIGAVDSFGNYASFSSQGNNFQQIIKPDISARGSGTYLINSLDNVVQGSGTSYSSPIIAGSIACLLQSTPSLTNNQIMDILRYTASQYESPDYYLGYGIPNFELAYRLGLNVHENSFFIFPNPVEDELNIISTFDKEFEIKLFDISGKLLLSKKTNGLKNILNMYNYHKGIYILEIKYNNGNSEIFKIVKN
jgi:hypothetical protein